VADQVVLLAVLKVTCALAVGEGWASDCLERLEARQVAPLVPGAQGSLAHDPEYAEYVRWLAGM
jgi:hypothetical protein